MPSVVLIDLFAVFSFKSIVAVFAFKSKAACVAVLIGFAASLVLFTKSNPTFDLFRLSIISLVIAPLVIEVWFPTLVTTPVKLAFVLTVAALPAARA